VVSSFFFFYSSSNLSRRRLDVCRTSTHGVALVRISGAGLQRAARGSLKIQDAKKSPKIAIWALSHKFDGQYLRNECTCRQSEKFIKHSAISPHNMVNFGPPAAEIDPIVWGIPANFNGFRVLEALLHGTPVVGVSQTLRR